MVISIGLHRLEAPRITHSDFGLTFPRWWQLFKLSDQKDGSENDVAKEDDEAHQDSVHSPVNAVGVFMRMVAL